MVKGMNQHDPAMILSAYAPSIVYTGNGEKTEGWDVLLAVTTAFHSAPENEDWRAEVDEIQVSVLSPDFALVAAWGRSGPDLKRPYAVTDLFKRTSDGWKVIHEHESTDDLQDEGR